MKFKEIELTEKNLSVLMPMFEKHWEEIARHKDIPLEVDVKNYLKAFENKGYKLFVALANEAPVGYAGYFVSPNLHYKSSLQAVQDVLYLYKNLRGKGTGSKFIKFCDDELRKIGVQVVYHHVKVYQEFGKILLDQGYEHIENIYSKRLDKG